MTLCFKARKESEVNSFIVNYCYKLKVILFESFTVETIIYIQMRQFERQSAVLRLCRGS